MLLIFSYNYLIYMMYTSKGKVNEIVDFAIRKLVEHFRKFLVYSSNQ